MAEEENKKINDTLVIFEHNEDKPYMLEDSSLSFDFGFDDKGESTVFRGGEIKTNYFIQNTKLDKVETWRFVINSITIDSVHVDAEKNMLTYHFRAEDFEDKTISVEADEEE